MPDFLKVKMPAWTMPFGERNCCKRCRLRTNFVEWKMSEKVDTRHVCKDRGQTTRLLSTDAPFTTNCTQLYSLIESGRRKKEDG